MVRKSRGTPRTDVSEDTARILFLTYGHDAVDMAVLRCAELKRAGDKAGLASGRRVLRSVRQLAAANRQERGTIKPALLSREIGSNNAARPMPRCQPRRLTEADEPYRRSRDGNSP